MSDIKYIDVDTLPRDFRNLYLLAINVYNLAKNTYDTASTIPFSLRIYYSELYNSHMKLVSASVPSTSEDLKHFKGRYDVFGVSKDIASTNQLKIGLMAELSLIVINVLYYASLQTTQSFSPKVPSSSKFRKADRLGKYLITRIANAWKLAEIYAVKDTSLLEQIKPYVNKYLNLKVGIGEPILRDVSNTYLSMVYYKFIAYLHDINMLIEMINNLSIYIDPDSYEYTKRFTDSYASIGRQYLVYPSIIPPQEQEIKL